MLLNYSEYGCAPNPPVILLHGLLGTKDNWHTIATHLSTTYRCLVPDLRNHGTSFHSEEMSYPAMVKDIRNFLHCHHLDSVSVIGHSMGGKVGMLFALSFPEQVGKLLVVDIAPRRYEPSHYPLLHALRALPLKQFERRKEIEDALAKVVPDIATRRMVLKNLMRHSDGTFQWKSNLQAIELTYPNIVAAIEYQSQYDGPTLFIRGENSQYIQMPDMEDIVALFPRAEIVTIAGAGHNVHVDAPDRFLEIVSDFLMS